jgi:hypothetical protein
MGARDRGAPPFWNGWREHRRAGPPKPPLEKGGERLARGRTLPSGGNDLCAYPPRPPLRKGGWWRWITLSEGREQPLRLPPRPPVRKGEWWRWITLSEGREQPLRLPPSAADIRRHLSREGGGKHKGVWRVLNYTGMADRAGRGDGKGEASGPSADFPGAVSELFARGLRQKLVGAARSRMMPHHGSQPGWPAFRRTRWRFSTASRPSRSEVVTISAIFSSSPFGRFGSACTTK